MAPKVLTYLGANLAAAAIPFLLLPVLTRVLGPEEYGRVAMFQTLVAVLCALAGLSTAGAATRKVYDTGTRAEALGTFIGTCLCLLLLTVAALTALAQGLAAPLFHWTGLEPTAVFAAVVVAAAYFIVQLRLGQWQARSRSLPYGAFQVGHEAVAAGAALTLVLGLGWNADGRIYGQAAAAAAAAMLALILLRRDGLLTLRWRASDAREALAFGLPLVPHMLGIFVLGSVDRLVIKNSLGITSVGIYMVAVQLSLVLAVFFDAVNKAYVPWLFARLARKDPAELRGIVRLTYLHFGCALGLAGLMALIAPMIVGLMAGPGYEAAAAVVGWIALGQAFHGMYLMVTNYLYYERRTGWLAAVTTGAGALNLALLMVMVPAFGLQGAAWAFCVSMALRFSVIWYLAQRYHPMPWRP